LRQVHPDTRCVSFDIQWVNVGNCCDFPFILRKWIERYN
jgi:hypothetical protein